MTDLDRPRRIARRALIGASLAGAAGAATVIAGGTSSAQAATATTTPDWIDITASAYGADPTGQADSTTAINNALSAVPAAGGVVYFPAGTYRVSGPLTVQSFTTLQGDGDGYHQAAYQAGGEFNAGSVIMQTSSTADGIDASNQSSIAIRNLAIIGPGISSASGSPVGSGVGINFTLPASGSSVHSNIEFLDFEDVYVGYFGSHGFSLETPIVSRLTRCAAEACGGDGFNLYGTFAAGNANGADQPGTSCTLTSCYANDCGSAGYVLTNLNYSSLHSCAAGASPVGFWLKQCLATTLLACGAETCATAFELTGTIAAGSGNAAGAGCHLIGCYSWANTSRAVLLNDGMTNSLVYGFVDVKGSPAAPYSID